LMDALGASVTALYSRLVTVMFAELSPVRVNVTVDVWVFLTVNMTTWEFV